MRILDTEEEALKRLFEHAKDHPMALDYLLKWKETPPEFHKELLRGRLNMDCAIVLGLIARENLTFDQVFSQEDYAKLVMIRSWQEAELRAKKYIELAPSVPHFAKKMAFLKAEIIELESLMEKLIESPPAISYNNAKKLLKRQQRKIAKSYYSSNVGTGDLENLLTDNIVFFSRIFYSLDDQYFSKMISDLEKIQEGKRETVPTSRYKELKRRLKGWLSLFDRLENELKKFPTEPKQLTTIEQ